MKDPRRAAIDRLRESERALREGLGPRRSLSPRGGQAKSLAELGELLIRPEHLPEQAHAFASGLTRIVGAFVRDYPDNIFWDLDLLAARMMAVSNPAEIERYAAQIEFLSGCFGFKSPIRFRYVHDFLYGFDWCRWVAKSPDANRRSGPFDPPFLEYLAHRQRELSELIASDDSKYGRLPESGAFRNPFVFSRDPDDERRLHEALSERDLIPVKSWEPNGDARWELAYADLRDTVAAELGLGKRPERPSRSPS